MNKFIKAALEEAQIGVEKGHGGPFGAVIVKDGKIIASEHNTVPYTQDPTAHAEINAIRKACKKVKDFNLSDCEIYITCEPCPMCLAAIIWAKMKKVTYACTKEDAAEIGFDDKYIYDLIKGNLKKKNLDMFQINREECLPLLKKWFDKENKINY